MPFFRRKNINQDNAFEPVFLQLKSLLEPYRAHFSVLADLPGIFSLETVSRSFHGRPLFFGSAQIKKNYVSFYLMPVYVFPDLLQGMPESLRKRMQGKSCFNFRKLDESALEDLRSLVRRGFERYQQDGLL